MTSVKRVDPLQAHEQIAADPMAVLVDVRSRMEFEYVGHPIGAVHVPWKEFPEWRINAGFADTVRALLRAAGGTEPDGRPVYLLCRSGARSLAAGEELVRRGFRHVYNIEEGFEGDKDADNHRGTINGWRFRGLPWEQG
jgi:rhodanese-related sulfurtransferase